MSTSKHIPATSVAFELAKYLEGITLARASAQAVQLATCAIADTVGVTLAGAAEECVRVLTAVTTSQAEGCTLIGQASAARLDDAVLVNGTAAHALDYDDMAAAMGGHPSVPVVPVVLALGETEPVDGAMALEAYLVGFEAECRLGRVVHPHHYERGWHPTATLGVFGAAAAAARILRLPPQQVATALCIAASMASGVKSNFGSMVKPFHVGHSARNGLLAAQLAQRGFAAGARALEDPQGFFAAFDGLAHIDLTQLIPTCGAPLEIEAPAVGLKQFPCCGSTHASVTAALRLRAEQALRAEDIEAVSIQAHRRRLPHTNKPAPRTGLESKFSIQYAVARALLSGPPGLLHFTPEAVLDPAIQRILGLTRVAAFEMDDPDGEMRARVEVHTRSGRILAEEADLLGRGAGNAMSQEELWTKFSDCSERVLSPGRSRQAFEGLMTLRQLPNLRDLARLFAADI